MTERGAQAVQRGMDFLTIGPSALSWDGAGLMVRINEIAVPLPRRIRGTVRLHPSAVETRTLPLDPAGRHRWRPIAPCARVEVALEDPSLSWSGRAYLDTNEGDRPLETDFLRWDWSRAPIPGGTAIHYDVVGREGRSTLAMHYDTAGGVKDLDPPPSVTLPSTLWRVPRTICADAPSVVETLEDTPFYARSIISCNISGRPATALHESLSLDRFGRPWVQAMLPFRMPRVGKWSGGVNV